MLFNLGSVHNARGEATGQKSKQLFFIVFIIDEGNILADICSVKASSLISPFRFVAAIPQCNPAIPTARNKLNIFTTQEIVI